MGFSFYAIILYPFTRLQCFLQVFFLGKESLETWHQSNTQSKYWSVYLQWVVELANWKIKPFRYCKVECHGFCKHIINHRVLYSTLEIDALKEEKQIEFRSCVNITKIKLLMASYIAFYLFNVTNFMYRKYLIG